MVRRSYWIVCWVAESGGGALSVSHATPNNGMELPASLDIQSENALDKGTHSS